MILTSMANFLRLFLCNSFACINLILVCYDGLQLLGRSHVIMYLSYLYHLNKLSLPAISFILI